MKMPILFFCPSCPSTLIANILCVCVCAATKWETLCQSLTARGSLINKLPDAELAQQEQQQQEQYKHCYVNAAALIKS